MSLAARDLLTRGIASAKAGERAVARRYLERSLRMQPDARQRVDAFYWLARLSESEAEKRKHLEQVLQLEPTHFAARRDLALLAGELSPSEVIDPAGFQPPPPPTAVDLSPTRFACPQCGGRMEFLAGSQRVTCRYCGYQATRAQALEAAQGVVEDDFIEALATAKGHLHPEATPTFSCGACGATYLLAANTLSLTCPHCGSVYVVARAESQRLVPPQGIVPFALDEEAAVRQLTHWLQSQGISAAPRVGEMRGLYLPAWTFDISGQVPFQYERHDGNRSRTERGADLILYNDLPVPASHRLPGEFADEIYRFDLSSLRPYDPGDLAGWPAETYQISATEAAMSARWYVLEQTRRKARTGAFGRVSGFRLGAASLLISAYRLVLLPVWLTAYWADGRSFPVMVNGQSGAVRGKTPPGGIRSFLRRILGIS